MSTDAATTPVERVLVTPAGIVYDTIGRFQGYYGHDCRERLDAMLNDLLHPHGLLFKDRPAAEKDPTFKQLIPYAVFMAGPWGDPQIFSYVRNKKQGESRLHLKRSLGIGGHINPVDGETHDSDLYMNAVRRELAEEVSFTDHHESQIVGFINDEENEVGRVHLGIVHRYELTHAHVTPKEDSMEDGRFMPQSEIRKTAEADWEPWSAILIKAMFGGFIKPT